jgi:malonyl-CoA O-methyltransferase
MKRNKDSTPVQKKESKAVKEFSRFAHQYNHYNMIQTEVAKELVEQLPKNDYETIVDIGCGSGEIYKNIERCGHSFKEYIALDYSSEMLSLHPTTEKIIKIQADFNSIETYRHFDESSKSILLSSSALQWSKDLDFTIKQLSKRFEKAYFTIFTSGTFKALHQVAKIDSPIYTKQALQEILERYYDASFKTRVYRLDFENVREMFQYIKKSGVSGGEKQLSYKQTKHLMQSYPLTYLEFEVLFMEGISKKDS